MVISDGFYNLTEGALSAASPVAASEAVAARTAVITATGVPFVRTTPLAKRIASDLRIDLHKVRGSGFSGRIFAHDLDKTSISRNVRDEAAQVYARAEAESYRDARNYVTTVPDNVTSIHEFETSFPENVTRIQEFKTNVPDNVTRIHEFEGYIQETPNVKTTDAMVAAVIAADENVAGVMRMNAARREVAKKTVKSSTETASVTQHMETDVTKLIALLSRLNANKEMHTHIPLKAFLLKALAVCIKEKERFRLRLAEAEDAYLLVDGSSIGLQFDSGDSIFTPILRNTEFKSLEEITSDINYYTEKAKRSAQEEERRGGTITLLDKGESGIYAFTPIINQPEAAILGIGSVYKRLVMTERSIENRQFIMQSLTFDHRIVNGAEADDFQKRLKEIIENPLSLIG
jgi:pyruvate dehydrogenase E2 component (dihydrolipoamide acetyltransferase)